MTKISLRGRLAAAPVIILLSLVLAAGTILSTRFQAQTTGSGSSVGASSSSSSTTTSAASSAPSSTIVSSDAPPVISLTVLSSNPQVSGYRPGVNARYATTITDDKALKKVVVTTSQMMFSSSTYEMYNCVDRISCEEKSYAITPSTPGAHFVTVTATDSAGQVTTKTVTFNADACSTDADCGGGAIQWAGASFCGSEAGGLETDIMQYGVAGICKSGGICDTTSLPRVKQKCASGQVCTFTSNGMNVCVLKPNACTAGAQISTVCTCGNATFNYPYDWRVNTPTSCCLVNGSFSTYGGSCPAAPASSPSSVPTLNGNGAPATITLNPLMQYGSDKYSIRIDDAGGIREMSITKRDGSSVWGGSPGALGNIGSCTGATPWRSLTSGTVAIDSQDFPLHVWGTHCVSTAVYMFDVSSRGEVLPYTMPPVQSSSSSSPLRPSAGSAATVYHPDSWRFSSPSRTASASTLPVPGTPSASAATPWYPAPSVIPTPGIAPAMTGSSSQILPQRATQQQQLSEELVRKLTKSQLRTLSSRKKTILRELIVLQKTLKQKRNKDALAHLEELRADVKAFEPVDASAYEIVLDFQDEVAELRLAAAKKAGKKAFR